MSTSVLYMSMSLDGFIAGPDDGPGQGLGAGGEVLHAWLGEPRRRPRHFHPPGPAARSSTSCWRPEPCWSGAACSTSPAAGTATTTTAFRSSS